MHNMLSRRQILGAATALPLVAAMPAIAQVGQRKLDMKKLDAVPAALQYYIDRGDLAGIVTMIAHRGQIVQVNTLGMRDLETRSPMQRDTIFRLASMTKPVTSVAALMLMEEGKLKLSDPITKWIPELANRRVLRKADGPIDDTVPAARDITVEDLMTHRAGMSLGPLLTGPIAQAYDAAIGGAKISQMTADQFLAGMGTLPLLDQPGTRMQYGVATDVLGFLIERVDGKTLQQSLKDRLFAPLDMKDTDFWVPPEKTERLASLYEFNEAKGALQKYALRDFSKPPTLFMGAGALVSTADDYMTFAQMLLRNGQSGKVRILKPETVTLMRTNRLTPAQRQFPFIGRPLWRGMGFGLGVATVEERLDTNTFNGSVGSYSWPGAWGTWWENDPVEDLTVIYMIQQAMKISPDAGAVLAGGRGVAYREALPTFERLVYEAVGSPAPFAKRY